MGEEVRFRDRAGPIALDIVAEVIFGVADNPRAERVRARAIAWLDTSRSTRRVIQTAWGDKPRRPLDPKLRPDHRLAAGGRGPGARGDRRARRMNGQLKHTQRQRITGRCAGGPDPAR
ncbi:hypothetical protein [Mycobacterium tuberculosis]|nr:hypothetical protein [Mycobacterium tuberculosis]